MRKTQIITLENANIEIVDGDRGKNYPKADEFSDKGYCVFLNTKNVLRNGFNFDKVMFISKQKDNFLRKGKIIRGDIVLTTRGTVGNVAVYDNQVPFEHIRINSGMLIFRPDLKYFYPKYLFRLFQSASIQNSFKEITSGSAQPQLPIRSLKYLKIPVPPLSNQEKLVDNIEVEENLVNANKKLIDIYEQKIKDKIAEVWGE
jgi:restriction endonuclease S subunit